MMSFGGQGLETSHHKCQSTSEASFEDGIVQVLYQRAPDIPYESPLSFRQTSRKNKRRSEACTRRGYLWPQQVQRISARRKSTDWKLAAEHGPTKSKLLSWKVPETTARRLKSEHLLKLKDECRGESTVPEVKSLHTKPQGRPLLLGKQLDKSVQEYIDAMRKVGGVVNTAIVMAAARGVIASRHLDCSVSMAAT